MFWNVLKFIRCCPPALTVCLCFFWSPFAYADSAPPPNDLCSGAEIIPGAGPFPYRSIIVPDITGATEAGDPIVTDTNCYQVVSRGLWYKFTPAVSAVYLLSVNDTATTVKDTLMGVFTSAGGCSGPFVLVACNDDAGFLQSAIATNLTANTPYYI